MTNNIHTQSIINIGINFYICNGEITHVVCYKWTKT